MLLISLIMPVYNGEIHLKRALDSVTNQINNQVEIIVINDGSIDSTREILKEYNNIKVVNTENFGVSHARNLGIKIARGEYLMFIDADDQLRGQSIRYISESLLTSDPDLLIFKRLDIHKEKHVQEVEGEMSIYNRDARKYTEDFLSTSKHTFSVCNKVYKKKIIVQNNLHFDEELKLSEDILFNLQYLFYCEKSIVFDTRAIYYRYWNKDSTIYKPIKSYFRKNIKYINKYKYFLFSNEISGNEFNNIIGNLHYATAKASLYRLYNDIDYQTTKERIKETKIIIENKEVRSATNNMKQYLEIPSDKLVNKLIKYGNAHLLYLTLKNIRILKKFITTFETIKSYRKFMKRSRCD